MNISDSISSILIHRGDIARRAYIQAKYPVYPVSKVSPYIPKERADQKSAVIEINSLRAFHENSAEPGVLYSSKGNASISFDHKPGQFFDTYA